MKWKTQWGGRGLAAVRHVDADYIAADRISRGSAVLQAKHVELCSTGECG
jgi:hypothetical protein